MKFFIRPDQQEAVSKQIAKLSKHLTVKPTISFSEPRKELRTEVTLYNNGFDGRGKSRYYIDVVEVDVDLESAAEWKLVATVYFRENILAMMDAKLFKDIPAHLGLSYKKCDMCGHSNSRRSVSHIFRNTVTGEWKQLGSECAKLIFGTGLDKFVVKLYEVFNLSYGSEPTLGGWMSSQPNNYFKEALEVGTLLSVVAEYRKGKPKWEKTGWDERYRSKVPGTTDHLNEYYDDNVSAIAVDEGLRARVGEYVSRLPESDFNSAIKEAFENGYVARHEVYKVFFAHKMYEDSLTEGDWEETVRRIKDKGLISLNHAELLRKDLYEDYYGSGWMAWFRDREGVTYYKTFSNWCSFEDKFKEEDGTFSFAADLSWVDNRKREIRLGGRVRKLTA